jgi:hypothetical protein
MASQLVSAPRASSSLTARSVDGDGVDEVLLVGGDGEAFAAALSDILGWAGYVSLLSGTVHAESIARVWTHFYPNCPGEAFSNLDITGILIYSGTYRL